MAYVEYGMKTHSCRHLFTMRSYTKLTERIQLNKAHVDLTLTIVYLINF